MVWPHSTLSLLLNTDMTLITYLRNWKVNSSKLKRNQNATKLVLSLPFLHPDFSIRKYNTIENRRWTPEAWFLFRKQKSKRERKKKTSDSRGIHYFSWFFFFSHYFEKTVVIVTIIMIAAEPWVSKILRKGIFTYSKGSLES